MIADGNGHSDMLGEEPFSPYAEVDPSLRKLKSASPTQHYDALAEIQLLIHNMVKLVQLRKQATDKGNHEVALQLDEAIFVKSQQVIKAKETGAKISNLLSNTWTTESVRHFALRVVGYISIVLPEISEEKLRMISSFINQHIDLQDVQGTTHTPDQDCALMDTTVPKRG